MSPADTGSKSAGTEHQRSGPAGSRAVPYIAAGGVALALWVWAVVWAARAGCAKEKGGVALPAARIDVNSADEAELEILPGIGRTLARRIVQERSLRGPFDRGEDLMRVRGFTRELVEIIEPFVAFGESKESGGSSAPPREREGVRP